MMARVAVVTGGTRGIGEAISLALGFGLFLETVSLTFHCLEGSHPRCVLCCSSADGREVLAEGAFLVVAAARSLDMLGTPQIPCE